MKDILRLSISLVAVFSMSACFGSKEPSSESLLGILKQNNRKQCERPPIEVFIQASPYLNPNQNGQSMPVEVRVFLLKERNSFDELDFDTVWQRGPEALAEDLVKTESFTVFPGKLKIYALKSKPEVSYVALVAIFRKPQADDWRYIFNIEEKNKRCATKNTLHTIVHAMLKDYRIERADINPNETKKP